MTQRAKIKVPIEEVSFEDEILQRIRRASNGAAPETPGQIMRRASKKLDEEINKIFKKEHTSSN